ncbi:hypothetical protein GQA08_24165 [Escherichia coli]|nr:hypothetical protein [Escherichia coli]
MSENKRLLQGAFPLTSIAHIGMSKNGLLSNMAISILPDLVVFVFFLTVFFENIFWGSDRFDKGTVALMNLFVWYSNITL